MTLGIISDAHHYMDQDGRLLALSPVVKQFEQWASLFEKVVVCAPLRDGAAPSTHEPYSCSNLRLLPIQAAGGDTLSAKLHLAGRLMSWWRAIQTLLQSVDAVHIRCPNNVSILGLVALKSWSCRRQAVYTGEWRGHSREPLTYRWQRWVLANFFDGPVAVYGRWPSQPPHVLASFSPSLSKADWDCEGPHVEERLARARPLGQSRPARLLSVGTLDRNKNQNAAIRAVRRLRDQDLAVELRLVGDGPEAGMLRRLIDELDLQRSISLCGRLTPAAVREQYRWADFVVQPSRSEGFSKVLVEAMCHGAIPLASDLPLNVQLLDERVCGCTFPSESVEGLAQAIATLSADPAEMSRLIRNGRACVESLTLEAWREHLRDLLRRHWKLPDLPPNGRW